MSAIRNGMRTNGHPARSPKKKIFISWSKNYSKQIALHLKDCLENVIFQGSGLACFVSDVDIASGEDWWNKIKRELKGSGLGILCVTKENIKEPWIYFEAGALVANNVDIIPLLISCDLKALTNSPINGKECVQFYEETKFMKMIRDINDKLQLLNLTGEQLNAISQDAYNNMKERLGPTLNNLKESRYFNEKYIYPNDISIVNKATVYISSPMCTLTSDEDYVKQRDFLIKLEQLLKNKIGFRDVICPAIRIPDRAHFDGNTKAISENYSNLKQADHMIVIYPNLVASSVLVEIGYGISLTKQTVIFYKDALPYMLKESGENISHVRTIHFEDYEEIISYILRNGKTLFRLEYDE